MLYLRVSARKNVVIELSHWLKELLMGTLFTRLKKNKTIETSTEILMVSTTNAITDIVNNEPLTIKTI